MADDLEWLAEVLGEDRADALWPHIEWAEMRRLQARHGFPSDNALPPPLSARLTDPDFLGFVAESLLDEGEDALWAALQRALTAAS